MAVCFLLYSVLPVHSTPDGVQCPTAPIQKVATAIRTCCGKITGVATRAPKPGEKGFVQCRCAEKRASTQKAILATKTPPFLPVEANVPEVFALPEVRASHAFCASYRSLRFPPFVLPPV